MRGIAIAALTASLFAVSVPAAAAEYVDAGSYLRSDAEYEAWYRVVHGLRRGFDDICGDTFCEGEYSNLESLRFVCSVERVSGVIAQCVWVFAGSQEQIDPATGRVQVQARSWRCKAPLTPRTTIEALLAALDGDAPLRAPLPGTQRSIYDGVIDCL
ncbi:MAG: hypothetical protein HOQ32_05245 [Lysobacter sp.]|nr:hypothetical protein [Lysobacter sp.]